MKTPTSNKKVQSLEQCSQLQLLKAYSHRFELNYILYQCENLSQGRHAYYFSFLYTLTRITPAYAGKTQSSRSWWAMCRDHPRVCGKNKLPDILWLAVKGSPPRMREKLHRGRRCCIEQGITPAYAGKTSTNALQVLDMWDHPRVCGKNVFSVEQVKPVWGSPPRMREKLISCATSKKQKRITPAYAGKTCCVFKSD